VVVGYAVGFWCILRDRFDPSKHLEKHWMCVCVNRSASAVRCDQPTLLLS